MSAYCIHIDGIDYLYDASLSPNIGDGPEYGPYQWMIRLERVVDVDTGNRIYEVLNRPWMKVGPEFRTREVGGNYLFGKRETSENWDSLIKEYQNLFNDLLKTRENLKTEQRTFSLGRPSQGRTDRLQFSCTPQLKEWLESKRIEKESLSETINRLLEGLKSNSPESLLQTKKRDQETRVQGIIDLF
jgi:hypothetical protein